MASKNLSSQGPKPKHDPNVTIKEILKIVDQLHAKLLSWQTSDVIQKSSSSVSESVPSAPVISTGHHSENVIHRLRRNLRMLEQDMIKVNKLYKDIGDEEWKLSRSLEALLTKVKDSSTTPLTKGMKKDLEDINKKIFKMMRQVPPLPNKPRKPKELVSEDADEDNNGKGIVCLPGIPANEEELKRLAVFEYVQCVLKNLSIHRKICLLSLAVFPENQEMNRTMLMYWWIGEGILPPNKERSRLVTIKHEEAMKEVLKEFMDKKLIEPVENKRKVEPNSYRVPPFVHSSLVLISKEIGLFDMYHKGKKPSMNKSDLKKVCLVEGSSSQREAKAQKMPAEDIGTVFNVSERYPDFVLKWFSEEQQSTKTMSLLKTYKFLKVFYLGRWERTPDRHIEVENPELMKNFKYMNKLRLLSLQGISRIERLGSGVCELNDLLILDLRDCYNLERLPDRIDWLTNLIYLDISGCHMIDGMPKRLCWLYNLEVLKGFSAGQEHMDTICSLDDLKHLKKLRKLSVTISEQKFGVVQLIKVLEGFQKLEKLKVAWGIKKDRPENQRRGDHKDRGDHKAKNMLVKTLTLIKRHGDRAPQEPKHGDHKDHKAKKKLVRTLAFVKREPKLPKTLKKLDLQCFPDADLPSWLKPENLDDLEKLYIKGGTELTGFGDLPEKPTECTVKVLRLKFLPKLKVEWRDLSEKYFPQMGFLEKYQCPQIGLCPTDGIGIWRKL